MLENLSSQFRGILTGTICAIVLTPIVVRLLQRKFPPRGLDASISPEVRSKHHKVAKQAAYAGLFAVAIPAIVLGPSTPVTFESAFMLLGLLFAGPTIWIGIRLLPSGTTSIREFSTYFEQEFRISFPRVAGFFIVASLIGLGWLAAFIVEP